MKRITLLLLAAVALTLPFTSCTSDEGITDDSGYTPNTDDDDDDDTTITPVATIQSYDDYPEVILESDDLGYLKRSEYFTVEVSNDTETKDIYVIADRNAYQMSEGTSGNNAYMTYHNHTADFSFSGDITIKVKRIDGGSLEDVAIYPKIKNYNYTVESDHVEITLSEWAYVYVEFPDLIKEPLFIFADPLETDIPSPTANNVELLTSDMSAGTVTEVLNSTTKDIIYFSPGVYNFAPTITDSSYPGYQLPLLSDKSYYIPRGAVIVGSFRSTSCSNNKMYGRGMITCSTKERLANSESIPYTQVYQEGGSGCTLEGIYFNNAAHFAVLSRNDLVMRNCKMTGWWHQSDGWGGGDNSVVEDCFFKSMDDNMKVYSDNISISNVILYKQINGAGIQYGWGGGGAKNFTLDGLYVIGDDNKNPGTTSNTAVVNLVSNSGNTISNHSYKNVYVECDYQRFLGIALEDGGFTDITFENIVIDGTSKGGTNYLANKYGYTGPFSNISFKDLVINGEKITSNDAADWNLLIGELDSSSSSITSKDLVEIVYE